MCAAYFLFRFLKHIPDCQPPARAFLASGCCYLFEPLGPRNFKAATNFCRENGAEVNFANEVSFAIMLLDIIILPIG